MESRFILAKGVKFFLVTSNTSHVSKKSGALSAPDFKLCATWFHFTRAAGVIFQKRHQHSSKSGAETAPALHVKTVPSAPEFHICKIKSLR